MPSSGNLTEFHGWAPLFRSIMYEPVLGKFITGTEKAPVAPAGSTETAAAAFEKESLLSMKRTVALYTDVIGDVGLPGWIFRYCVSGRPVLRSDLA